jgi:SAM-dependent methyltransferase
VSDWITRHRTAWEKKSGLRRFYQGEIFDPLLAASGQGTPVLELGAGPGFLAAYVGSSRDLVSVDIEPSAAALTCDVHDLPFAAGHFAAVIGVDCLHHFARPADALNEISRVLRPGGRLVLCEPWTGTLGWPFYRYIHHEDCAVPLDPFVTAFGPEKSPMDGNAAIPKIVLHDRKEALAEACPGIRVISVRPFGALAYALTGGFQGWGLPAPLISALARFEGILPRALMQHMALRALFVLEKC